jgi:hypothetical protein
MSERGVVVSIKPCGNDLLNRLRMVEDIERYDGATPFASRAFYREHQSTLRSTTRLTKFDNALRFSGALDHGQGGR